MARIAKGLVPAVWRPWVDWLGAVGWGVALLLVAGFAGPQIVAHPLVAYAVGFAVVAGQALVVSALAPRVSVKALWVLAVPMAALLAIRASGNFGIGAAAGVTACLLIAGTLVGAVVGGAIEHPGHLGFVAVVAALADVFSVFHPAGPTAAIMEAPAVLGVLALPWPMLGTPFVEPFLGVGEVVFASLYVSAARVHGLSVRRTMAALGVGFALTMGAVLVVQVAIPALPFLGAAVIAAHPEARRPPAKDARKGAIAVGLLAAGIAAMFLWTGW